MPFLDAKMNVLHPGLVFLMGKQIKNTKNEKKKTKRKKVFYGLDSFKYFHLYYLFIIC